VFHHIDKLADYLARKLCVIKIDPNTYAFILLGEKDLFSLYPGDLAGFFAAEAAQMKTP
jgi:hypothetical protein